MINQLWMPSDGTVLEIFPHAAVAPGLFIAASDSKHFWNLAPQIYRFNPIQLTAEEKARLEQGGKEVA